MINNNTCNMRYDTRGTARYVAVRYTTPCPYYTILYYYTTLYYTILCYTIL